MDLITRYSHLDEERLLAEWRELYQGLVVAVAFGKDAGESGTLEELESEIMMRMGRFPHIESSQVRRVINTHYRKLDAMRNERAKLLKDGEGDQAESLDAVIGRLHDRVSLLRTYDMTESLREAKEREKKCREKQ